ncbi:inorganic phosphate transporter [Methanothermobacter thermautotrophicus]|jgi:PiT family inorganic phosphate transporter|uniref:Inorganic phosphate transporter n=2 Tax=Methanothermobacter thermautotrophicus TaxID=145262 RepID=A0A842YMJ8_METTF|nr:inorganic phosphate transporter [Methanothermobacter thermautotrophicus]MCQ8905514.1 anion permease [Methanothermobacter sp.]
MDKLMVISLILSLYMAFNIAANDIGNSVGTAVGSGSIKMRRALLLGAFFVSLGAILLGGNVIKTISEGIIPQGLFSPRMALVVTATASIWITFTLIRKIPISGSDAIVSSVIGAGITAVGIQNMNLDVIGFIVLSWLISPLAGLLTGFLIYHAIRNMIIKPLQGMGLRDRAEKIFSYLQVLSSSFSALNLGAIDIAVAVGVIFAVGSFGGNWIRILGVIGLVAGILLAGNRVTETIGRRITDLTPSRGFSAQLAAAVIVYLFMGYGMPVSPTQTLIGSVIGVGIAHGTSTVKYDVIGHIAYTWMVTIPTCIILSSAIYIITGFLG